MAGRWDKLSCERLMIEKYWLDHGGGTLCFEVPLVTRSREGAQRRLLDGLIIPGGETGIVGHQDVEIAGKEVVIIQAKCDVLGMSLMGQAVFSLQLMKRLGPASVRSIALCVATDPVLEALLDPYRPEVSVSVVTKQEVEALRKQKEGVAP